MLRSAAVDHLPVAPRPDPPPKRGGLARARAHLVDLTPLRISSQFRTLFLGKSISDFGDEIIAVVLPFQVFQTHRLDRSRSACSVSRSLCPVFVFPIVGGAFADALERRRLVTITYALLAAMSLLMAANALRPEPLLWPLYVFAFLSAGLYTFNRPALDTWPARLLDPELLPSSNALDAGFGTAIGMLGPVAAGVAIALIAPVWRLRVRCDHLPRGDRRAALHASVASVGRNERGELGGRQGRVPVPEGKADDPVRLPRGSERDDLRVPDGAAARRGAHARSRAEAQVLGLLFAAPAAGAFIATLVSGSAKDVRRQGRAIMLAIVVWGAAIVVFGLSQTIWLSLLMLAVAGAGDMVSGIFRQTILQAAVEDRYRGRLGGISMAVWATGPSLGDVESGVVATLTTVPVSIVSGGLICIAGIGLLGGSRPGSGATTLESPRRSRRTPPLSAREPPRPRRPTRSGGRSCRDQG